MPCDRSQVDPTKDITLGLLWIGHLLGSAPYSISNP